MMRSLVCLRKCNMKKRCVLVFVLVIVLLCSACAEAIVSSPSPTPAIAATPTPTPGPTPTPVPTPGPTLVQWPISETKDVAFTKSFLLPKNYLSAKIGYEISIGAETVYKNSLYYTLEEHREMTASNVSKASVLVRYDIETGKATPLAKLGTAEEPLGVMRIEISDHAVYLLVQMIEDYAVLVSFDGGVTFETFYASADILDIKVAEGYLLLQEKPIGVNVSDAAKMYVYSSEDHSLITTFKGAEYLTENPYWRPYIYNDEIVFAVKGDEKDVILRRVHIETKEVLEEVTVEGPVAYAYYLDGLYYWFSSFEEIYQYVCCYNPITEELAYWRGSGLYVCRDTAIFQHKQYLGSLMRIDPETKSLIEYRLREGGMILKYPNHILEHFDGQWALLDVWN